MRLKAKGGAARPSAGPRSSQDPQLSRAAYLGMNLTTWFVILPLAAASLVSGMICSLGTALGLFRYYWVVMKLSISLFSSMVLVIHLQPIERLAVAAHGGALGSNLHQAQLMIVVASAVAVAVFALLTALSVYRPRGLTPYGARRSGP